MSSSKTAGNEENLSSRGYSKDDQGQKNLTREKTLIEQLPAFPTIAQRSNNAPQSSQALRVTAAETTATGSRSRADAVDYASFTWPDLSGMSRTNAVKTSEPHLIHQDTDKTLTKTKNSPEQEQPQGIQSILPVDSTKPVQRPEKKAPKPFESLLGIGQNFVAPKSDEPDEYPQTVDLELHEEPENFEDDQGVAPSRPRECNWNTIQPYTRPVKKLSDGEACYPPSPSMHSASLDLTSDDDEDFESLKSETECPSDVSTYGSSTDTEDGDENETETCPASPCSHFSFDMIDAPDCREHSGSSDKGKRKAKAQGSRTTGSGGGQQRNGKGDAQKRAKNSLSMDLPGGNPDDGDEENGDDDESVDANIPGERRLFACPYYKRDPDTPEYQKCATNGFTSVSRVKGHVLRTHLKPLQCDRCGKFRAGDEGQIKKHLRTTNCEKPANFIPVDGSIVQKGKDLKKGSRKAMTWKQVYVVLFGSSENEVPSEYIEPIAQVMPPAVQATQATVRRSTSSSPPTVPESNKDPFVQFVQTELTALMDEPVRRLVSSITEQLAGQLPLLFENWSAQRAFAHAGNHPGNHQREHAELRIPSAGPSSQNQDQGLPAGNAASIYGTPPFMRPGMQTHQQDLSGHPLTHSMIQGGLSRGEFSGSHNNYYLSNYAIIGQPAVQPEPQDPEPDISQYTNLGDYTIPEMFDG